LGIDHYENFPVASVLLPRRMRAPIEAIYGFARGADDIADEGDLPDAARLAGLDRYRAALDAIEAEGSPEAQFARIADAIRTYELPVQLLRDLIDAFSQDVVKKRYADFAQLMDYSRRSANPVGRLVLHVFERVENRKPATELGFHSAKIEVRPRFSVEHSDLICSALQLINFWQDVAIDWQKGRLYIPQEDLTGFGISESRIASASADGKWRELMAFECARARRMLAEGSALGSDLPGRLGLEIRATVAGGAAILDKIDAVRGDVFRHRPTLGKLDWIKIIGKAVSGKMVSGTNFPGRSSSSKNRT
jgi:phytoene/squalene synthetase